MERNQVVRHYISQDGERVSLLVNSDGLPVYYPTLFATSQLRNASQAAGTIRQKLNVLKLLSCWEEIFKVDLVQRIKTQSPLEHRELISLRDFCTKDFSKQDFEGNVVSLFEERQSVSNSVQYNRMSFIAEYLEFLTSILGNNNRDMDVRKELANVITKFRHLRPRQESRFKNVDDIKGLSSDTADQILEITEINHPDNPFKVTSQLRNFIILAVLRFTGVRRAELLNIRINDVDTCGNTLSIVRRPDDKGDSRTYQPTVKTAERKIPIDPSLTTWIQKYVLEDRSRLSAARKHPYLFVNHSGQKIGAAMKIASLDKVFDKLKQVLDDRNISAHRFRHFWNYEYSLAIDSSKQDISSDQENQSRSYLMGWSPTSGMAANYNRRRIKEIAHKAIRDQQNKIKSVLIKEEVNEKNQNQPPDQ